MALLRILYVEDEVDLRDGLAEILRQEGFDVVTAPTAEEALSLLQGGTCDLLMTDFRMPGHNGDWLVQQARAQRLVDGVPIFVISAERKLPPFPGCRIFAKPIDLDELLRAVSDVARSLGVREPEPKAQSRVDLVLYVSRQSITSLRAIRNLERAIRQFPPGEVTATIFTVGEDGLPPPADRIVFTPTLVRHRPAPLGWVLGDLSDTRHVLDLIEVGGVSSRREVAS